MPVIRPFTQRARFGVGLLLTLPLWQCTPDFDSLSRGGDAREEAGSPGDSEDGGASDGGVGAAGGAGMTEATAGGAPSAGQGGDSMIVEPLVGGAGANGGEGGAGGVGMTECVWLPTSSHYDGFDGGLDGMGFASVVDSSSSATTKGATATSAWDPDVGKTCPGAVKLSAAFTDYAAAEEPVEQAFLDLRFDDADWTGASALHVWVRVSPSSAPLSGLQVFVISGASYLYASIFDDYKFLTGKWNEMVIPLEPGANFDPSLVRRAGVQISLKQSGASGNPKTPPVVDVWLDDLWLEE